MPWRPYEHDPLFTPELILGPDALPTAHRRLLITYLEQVAERRGVLHTAVAFNAVYFGYDLDYGGYPGGPVDFDRLPTVHPATSAPPVGAMVKLIGGSEPLFGEVLYEEGAHTALLDDGEAPAWLSGAPRDGAGSREGTEPRGRLVVDFDAFGQELTTTRERMGRLRRKGGLLDQLGHVLLPPSGDESIAEYLLGPARDCLLTGPLPLLLGADASAGDLEAGVRGALRTLDLLLSEAAELRRWQGYAFCRTALAARFTDDEGELGGSDLRTIIAGMTRPPSSARRHRRAETVTHTAVGPRLRSFVANQTALGGLAYAVAVCHANTALSDTVRSESDEKGALPSGGHMRLDDAWQGGGIWRVEHPPGPHAELDPLQPLGLGWLESLPPGADAPVAEEETPAERLTVTDSQIDWTTRLRLRHHVHGILPLPAHLKDELAHDVVRLRLTHDGYELDLDEADQTVRVSREANELALTGVCWPLEYFPGIVLDVWWPRGAPTLNARSTLLDVPVTIDGALIEHRYDPGIVTRDRAPGCSTRGPAPRLGLRERIVRAVRRAGLLQDDGEAVLPEEALARVLLGERSASVDDLAVPLAELVTEGILRRSTASRTIGGSLIFPATGSAAVSVLVWSPTAVPVPRETTCCQQQGLTVRLGSHEVRSFLRRLRPGEQASEAARAEYQRVAEQFGFGPSLPSGYTIVRAHRRGG